MARALAKSKSVCRRVTRNPTVLPPSKYKETTKAPGSIVFRGHGVFEVTPDGREVPYVRKP